MVSFHPQNELDQGNGMNTELLISKFKDRKSRICIVGLGYVGLPLSATFAKAGHQVIGIDIDPSKVNLINQGISYIADVCSADIKTLVDSGRLQAAASYNPVAQADAVIICVPTPLDDSHDPDLSYIIHAIKQISCHAHKEMLLVLESTTYPGTTREVIVPILTKAGFEIGKDVCVCFSPERIDPGRKDWTAASTPKVIGGITDTCLKTGLALYESALPHVIAVSNADTAEMVKILENSFRAVNIAFINEMMTICDKLNLDIWEIIEAAGTKPFGFMKFNPGPGVGGHCIPVDPLYLKWKLAGIQEQARFISLAHEVNSSMPRYWIAKAEKKIRQRLGKNLEESRILVLGLAYKKDVDDMRESPSLDILKALIKRGAHASYHDPFIPFVEIKGNKVYSVQNLRIAIAEADCVILATDHTLYENMDLAEFGKIFINCRGHSDSKVQEENMRVAN
jgi:UDP-N-acetyl-D-glucosamine dehydrogenase